MKDFKEDAWWFGRKYPSPDHKLDFWKLNSKGFKELNDSGNRENFIAEIAKEIDTDIKAFQKKSKEIKK
jgi:hypothetical protein